MPIASANPYPSVLIVEGSAPAAPAAGQQRLYVDSADHLLKWKDSSSVVRIATGQPLGLTGAVAAARFVGGTASVAPTTGTFAVGDFVVAQSGGIYVCTVAGTPGTWVAAAGATPALNGASVYMSTTQSFNATTLTYMTFDSELIDTASYHDPVTNNGRLVAPLTGKYRISGGIWYASTSGVNYILFDKNHAGAYIGALSASGVASGCSLATPPTQLTAGDYIEMVGYHTQSGTVATGDGGTTPSQQNWFAMEYLGS